MCSRFVNNFGILLFLGVPMNNYSSFSFTLKQKKKRKGNWSQDNLISVLSKYEKIDSLKVEFYAQK